MKIHTASIRDGRREDIAFVDYRHVLLLVVSVTEDELHDADKKGKTEGRQQGRENEGLAADAGQVFALDDEVEIGHGGEMEFCKIVVL